MFSCAPVKHFSFSLNAPFTSISCYVWFISIEGKDHVIPTFVYSISYSAVPVMWPLLRDHGTLGSVMSVIRIQGTKETDPSPALYE